MSSTFASKDLTTLGTRASFNKTLRHIVNVTSLIEAVGKGSNLADQLNAMVEGDVLKREQLAPILSVVLVSKYEFPYSSINVSETVSDFSKIVETFTKWNAVNMVVAYHHPNFGMLLANPANAAHWDAIHDLKKDELMVVYAQTRNKNPDSARKAIDALLDLMAGKEPQESPDFIDVKKPAPAPKPAAAAAPAGKRNLTPKYSVQVSNELFHNGNVEAWKNIIESYEAARPGCQVIVYHEGELIQDLNSLFKWGKVKHGGLIFFQVAGTNIKGVSRLQKYLYEGASARYETFMKHDVNKVLNLF